MDLPVPLVARQRRRLDAMGSREGRAIVALLLLAVLLLLKSEMVSPSTPSRTNGAPVASSTAAVLGAGAGMQGLRGQLKRLLWASSDATGCSNQVSSWNPVELDGEAEDSLSPAPSTPSLLTPRCGASRWQSVHVTSLPYWRTVEDQAHLLRSMFPVRLASGNTLKSQSDVEDLHLDDTELEAEVEVEVERSAPPVADPSAAPLPSLHFIYTYETSEAAPSASAVVHSPAVCASRVLRLLRDRHEASPGRGTATASLVEFLYNGAAEKSFPPKELAQRRSEAALRHLLTSQADSPSPTGPEDAGQMNSVVESIYQLVPAEARHRSAASRSSWWGAAQEWPVTLATAFGARFGASAITEESMVDGKVAVHGRGTVVVELPVKKGRTLNVVTQIMENRFDKSVSVNNCAGYSIGVEVRSQPLQRESSAAAASASMATHANTTSMLSMLHDSEEEEDDEDDDNDPRIVSQSTVWNVFANLFDNSMICEVVPSVPLRVPPSPTDAVYYLVIAASHSHYLSALNSSNFPVCQLQIFVGREKAAVQNPLRHIFAFLVPVLFLTLPMPFLVRYTQLIRETMVNTDFIEFLWSPAIFLQLMAVAGGSALWMRIRSCIYRRHRQRRPGSPTAGAEDFPTAVVIENGDGGVGAEQHRINGGGVAEMQGERGDIIVIPPMPEGWGGFDALRERRDSHTSSNRRSQTASPASLPDRELAATLVQPADASGREADDLEKGKEPNERQQLLPAGETCREERSSAPSPPETAASPRGRGTGLDDEEEEEKVCRICRDGDQMEELVAPCECTGSVRWIHRSCLDRWRLESAGRNQNNVNNCEICRKPFTIGIKRSTVFAERYHFFVNSVLLCIACVLVGVVLLQLVYEGIGGLSCFAAYHRVNRRAEFTVDGMVITLVYYTCFMLLVLYARCVVFSWFRNRPEVVAYLEDMQVMPPFWIRRNIALVVLVVVVMVLQVLSMGYLFKYFSFLTSNLPWSWEASPFIGGMLFSAYLSTCMNFQEFLQERFAQQRARQEAEAAAAGRDAAEEDGGMRTTIRLVGGVVGSLFSGDGSGAAPTNSGFAVPPPPPHNAEVTERTFAEPFDVPPEQRIIRAYEYSPPTRRTNTKPKP